MFGRHDEKTDREIPADMNLVHLAIPRRIYTQSRVYYVIEVFAELLKEKIKGLGFTEQVRFLRHSTEKFEPV